MDGTSAESGETLQGFIMNVDFRVTIGKELPGHYTSVLYRKYGYAPKVPMRRLVVAW